uniref:Major facilitator superfamily (MFS) profile domain-containing protein n=1 Tax=Candidatus Methanophaga sp. ANME-1 ERB7 TaxID=2759913 RepID=A0A7G9Z377_9EURY|nr:hypothetical protein PDBAIGND_00017 [Methanosarcinales archaeon ANME-1 ERB7]
MIGGPLLLTLFMQNTDYVGSYRKMVICLAILGALLLYTAVFAVDEKRFSNARPSEVPLADSFKKTVRNKAFIIYLFANISLWFLFNIVRSSVIPIVITLMGADEAFASNIFTILFVIAAICFPVVGFFGEDSRKESDYDYKSWFILNIFYFPIPHRSDPGQSQDMGTYFYRTYGHSHSSSNNYSQCNTF